MNEISPRETPSALTTFDPNVHVSASTAQRLHDATPANTRRGYAGDWNRFVEWCAAQDRQPLPATPQTITEYVNHLADLGRAPNTINRVLSSIIVAHEAAGMPKPETKAARLVLRAYRRQRAEAGHSERKAKPMTVDNLRALVAGLDADTLAGGRDLALIVLGFALGARRSELVALNIADLTETADGYEVVIRASKTDKDSHGRTVSVPYGSDPRTCPVRTVNAWLARLAEHGAMSGPLFRRIDKHGNLGRAPHGKGDPSGRLTGQAVAYILRRAALRAGIAEASMYSGHSLRRGFATEAYRAGADPLRIARHGGWQDGSRVLYGYIEQVDRWRDNPLRGIGL